MKLFRYEGFQIVIAPEAYALKPFKVIWDRDTSKDKSVALQELAFVYFYADPRSDYMYLVNDDERLDAIRLGEGLSSDWKPDKELDKAIEFYKSFKPMSAMLLEDTYYMIDKLRHRMRNVDYDERDEKGKPIYTFESVTKTINQIPALIKTLGEAMDRVNKEIIEQEKARGNVEMTVLDKDLDIWLDK